MKEPIRQKRRVIVVSLLLFTLAILLPGLIVWAVPAQQTSNADSGTEACCSGGSTSGCTVFTVAKGNASPPPQPPSQTHGRPLDSQRISTGRREAAIFPSRPSWTTERS
jgi:hypothetical protein